MLSTSKDYQKKLCPIVFSNFLSFAGFLVFDKKGLEDFNFLNRLASGGWQ